MAEAELEAREAWTFATTTGILVSDGTSFKLNPRIADLMIKPLQELKKVPVLFPEYSRQTAAMIVATHQYLKETNVAPTFTKEFCMKIIRMVMTISQMLDKTGVEQ